jgi:hypothetical protein
MTFSLILTVIYLLIVFLVFAMFFVGGEADARTEEFLKEYERKQ